MLSLRPWLFGGTFQLEVGFAMGFAKLARGVLGTKFATAFRRLR
jgi:hypothetical protein